MVTILDLSNNNPEPDFRAVKRGGAFGVLLKVSEATTFTDPDVRELVGEGAGRGVACWGGYHFARPERTSAVAEADFFCDRLGKVLRRDLHPALDLETNDAHLTPAELIGWIRRFQARVRTRTGARCLLYSYTAFIVEQSWREPPGTGAGLWLANYGPNDGHDHGANAPAPWKHLVAHQFTSVGSWPGCSGRVDLSHAKSRRRMLAHGLRGLI